MYRITQLMIKRQTLYYINFIHSGTGQKILVEADKYTYIVLYLYIVGRDKKF